MSVINFKRKEIVAKVVFYGPGLSGKTTNVQKIFESMPAEHRGELTSLATEQDRTLFFDYVPIHLGNIGGFKTRFQLFTVPGQVYYSATRRVVLQGTDGVVFVADSSPDAIERNLESLADLRQNLLHYDKFLNAIPFVIQYNKRDVPGALSVDTMDRELNQLGVPRFEAVAVNGKGVLETLSRISSLVLAHLKTSIEGKLTQGRKDTNVQERFDDEAPNDASLVRNLLSQISEVRRTEHAAEVSIVDEEGETQAVLPQRPDRALLGAGADASPSPSTGAAPAMPPPMEHEISIGNGRVGGPPLAGVFTHPGVPPVSEAMAASKGTPNFGADPNSNRRPERVIEHVDVEAAFRTTPVPSPPREAPPASVPRGPAIEPVPSHLSLQPVENKLDDEISFEPTVGRAMTGAAQASIGGAGNGATSVASGQNPPGVQVGGPGRPPASAGGLTAFQPGDAPPWDPRSPSSGVTPRQGTSNGKEASREGGRETGMRDVVKEAREAVREAPKEVKSEPVAARDSAPGGDPVRSTGGGTASRDNMTAPAGRPVSAPVGNLEVVEVLQVSRRGNGVNLTLQVREGNLGPVKTLNLTLNLTDRELPPVKVVVPLYLYGWLVMVTLIAAAALALGV